MSQQDQKTAKEHYYDWYMHNNNEYYSNHVIFRKGYKNEQNKSCGMKNR